MILLRPSGFDHGLFLGRTGTRSFPFQGSGGGGGTVPAGLTLQLTAYHVNLDGNMQAAVANNTTTPTIYGVAPFMVWYDGTDSVSVASNADTPGKALVNLNNLFDSGEGIAGNWSLTGRPRNRVEGQGAYWFHIYEEVGTHESRMYRIDSDGRLGYVKFNVVVLAPDSGVDMAPGGSWPPLTDYMVLNCGAGDDLTGKGDLNLNGTNGVYVRKVGSGADPRVTNINLDSRNIVHTATTRTRNARIDGIHMDSVGESSIGPLHCSVLNCNNPFRYNTSGLTWDWVVNLSNSDVVARNNMAYTRGLGFWNSFIESRGDSYVMITQARDVGYRNCVLDKNTGDGGQHVFRGDYCGADMSYNVLLASATASSAFKGTGWEIDGEATPDDWNPGDRLGEASTGQLYVPLAQKIMVRGNIIGGPGADNFSGIHVETLPENNVGSSPKQPAKMIVVADNVRGTDTFTALWMRGQDTVAYNNLTNNGAGDSFGTDVDQRGLRVHGGFDRPNTVGVAPPPFPPTLPD